MMNFFGRPGMMDYGPSGFMAPGFGFVAMILWWIIIIVALVYVIKWLLFSAGVRVGDQKNISDILKERYAKGEIDKKEFEEKKKDLGLN